VLRLMVIVAGPWLPAGVVAQGGATGLFTIRSGGYAYSPLTRSTLQMFKI